jgi:two-component system, OmpR family, phosphate regulon sensor histidine kinase PhoR
MAKILTKLLISFLLSVIFLLSGSLYAIFFSNSSIEAASAVFFSFIIGNCVFFVLTSSVIGPIKKILISADRISKGDFSQRLAVKSNDEIGYLESVFNRILDNFEQSGKKLKEEREELKAIISSMGEGLLVLDTNLRVLLMNQTAEKSLNVKFSDAAGKRVTEILRLMKGDKEVSFEEYPARKMLRTGKAVTVGMKDNIYYKAIFGKTFPVEIVTAPFSRNGIVGAVVIFKDITEMKIIEEEREFSRVNLENVLKSVYIERDAVSEQKNKLEAVLNSIGDAVFVVNREKKVVIFNPAAEEITGFKFKDIKGRFFDRYLKFSDEFAREEKIKNIEHALNGETTPLTNYAVLETKKNKEIHIEESVTLIKNRKGKIVGCAVVFRDITAKRKLEMMRSNFISIVSHQLRTPLSATKWFLEILITGDIGMLKPKQKDVLKEIYTNNESMIDLVNTMLNMSRLESKQMIIDPDWINLDNTVRKILAEIKPFLDKKKQKFKYIGMEDRKLKINTDKILLKNIINNIIMNASRYTAAGGSIKFEVLRKDKDYLLFKISDNGIGIPREDQRKIFKKFFRAANAIEYEVSGTGFGLYLVKSILEMINGEIWFESKENKGTTFSFTLPIEGIFCKIRLSRAATRGRNGQSLVQTSLDGA